MITEIRRGEKKYIGLFNVSSEPLPDNIVNPFVAVIRLWELYGITDVEFDKPVPTKKYSSEEIERIALRHDFKIYGVYVEESEYEKIKKSEVSISNILSLPCIELSEQNEK
jgi:hypothetical protein